MTDTSLILGLPYIQPSQAQKHVTHNEALRVLDALVQLSVVAADLSLPPTGAAAAERYIVAGPGQGAWAGHDDEIAIFDGITWTFIAPLTGWQAYVSDTGGHVLFDGSAWLAQGADMVDSLGINAAADTYNRLSVASDAILLNHAGTGHQVKVNKASATDTASLLFQTGFAGRAEMGIAGNDDFSIKVSADGGTWAEALRIDAATGMVTLPRVSGRTVLSAPRIYYVDPVLGSDANDGLGAGASGFASLARALEVVQGLNANGHSVTVQLADGTHAVSAPLVYDAGVSGQAQVTLQGNVAAPTQVVLDGAGTVVQVVAGHLALRGVQVQSASTTAPAIEVRNRSTLSVEAVDFGAAPAGHIKVVSAHLYLTGDYSISGSADAHIALDLGAVAEMQGGTVSLSGTPDFPTAFFVSASCSAAGLIGVTYTGSATGPRYLAATNGTIDTGGEGTDYLPGDAAGSKNQGGRYV